MVEATQTNRGEKYEEGVYFMRFFNKVHKVVNHNLVNYSFFITFLI